MLDPDPGPDSMNPDPRLCFYAFIFIPLPRPPPSPLPNLLTFVEGSSCLDVALQHPARGEQGRSLFAPSLPRQASPTSLVTRPDLLCLRQAKQYGKGYW